MQRKHREMESTLYKNEQERLHVDRLEFFTNITHELCSPLTMIMAMCDILQKNTDEEKQKKFEPYIESLRCHSRRLNELLPYTAIISLFLMFVLIIYCTFLIFQIIYLLFDFPE